MVINLVIVIAWASESGKKSSNISGKKYINNTGKKSSNINGKKSSNINSLGQWEWWEI